MSRCAVVTGGGTGIGRAIARRLASDGAEVVIVGRRGLVLGEAADAINAELGGRRVTWHQADLTDVAAVEGLAASLATSLAAPVDVLVNNAGGNFGRGAVGLSAVADAYRADFEGNVLTTVLTTAGLLPLLRRPGGRIVTISSIAGLRGSGSYGAAKAALHAWNMTMATDLAADGVTANVVAPGFVPDTEFWDGLSAEDAAARMATIPMGRAGTPDEVAALVAYLAADDAGWTTGQIVQVNGGTLLGRG